MSTISIPLIKTTEDKAITNMNERGGMGHEGDLTEIGNIENDPNNKLVEKVKVKAGDITETFICFRHITDYPIKTKSNQQQQNKIGFGFGQNTTGFGNQLSMHFDISK